MRVTSKGLDDILKGLSKLNVDAQNIGEKAVRKVAKDVAKELEQNTPYDPSSRNPSHLRDNVIVKTIKTRDGGYKLAYVTYSRNGKGANDPKDVLWRASFVEWGTIHSRPQGMVAKTVQQVKDNVAKQLEDEMRRLL